jgi:hypothetical protein
MEEREPGIERNAAANCEDRRSRRQIARKWHEFAVSVSRWPRFLVWVSDLAGALF